MSQDLNLTLRLNADGSGLIGTVRVSKRELDKLSRGFDGTARSADRLEKESTKTDSTLKRMRGTVGSLRNGFSALRATVGSAIAALGVRQVYEAGRTWIGYEQSLKVATGSHIQAAREIAFVRAESKRLGTSLDALLPSYSKLANAAKGTELQGQATRDIFTAIVEASKVFNLTNYETEGALNAVQQMMSKGKVQAEELRGQLGERLPGAFKLAAQAMNVTEAELNDMLDNGQVLAVDLLPKLAKVLREEVAGAAEEMADETSANVGRMQTAWGDFWRAVSEAGGDRIINAGAQMLTGFLNWAAESVYKVSGGIQVAWLKVQQVFGIVVVGIQSAWNGMLKGLRTALAAFFDTVAAVLDNIPTFGDTADDFRAQAAAIRANSAETKSFSEALREHNAEYNAAIDNVRTHTDTQVAAFQAQQQGLEDTTVATVKAKEQTKGLTDEQQKLLDTLLPGRAAAREYAKAWQEIQNLNLSPDEKADAIEQLNKILMDELFGKEKTKKQTDIVGSMYENLAKGIQSSFKTTFRNVFDEGIDGFADFTDTLLNMFLDVLAEMAATAIAKPIVVPLVSSGAGNAAAGGAAAAGAGSLGLGLAAVGAGLVVGSMLSQHEKDKAKREEEKRRLREARDMANRLFYDINDWMSVLTGSASKTEVEMRKLNRAIAAQRDAASRGDMHDRVSAEARLVELMKERYELERSLLNEVKQTIEVALEDVRSLRNEVRTDIADLLGIQTYRDPGQIGADIGNLYDSLMNDPGALLPGLYGNVANVQGALNDINTTNADIETLDFIRRNWRSAANGPGSDEYNAAVQAMLAKYSDIMTFTHSGETIKLSDVLAGNSSYKHFNDYDYNRAALTAQNALKDRVNGYQDKNGVYHKGELQEALTTSIADLEQAFADSEEPLADIINQFGDLREETLRYYDAQKQLADALSAASGNIDNTLTSIYRSQMNPIDRLGSMRTEFDDLLNQAKGASGVELAGLANQLAALAQPLLAQGKNVFASGAGFTELFDYVTGALEEIQGQVDDEIPTDYEQTTVELLGRIDENLLTVEGALGYVGNEIVEAIDQLDESQVGQLKIIADRLGEVVGAASPVINLKVVTPDDEVLVSRVINELLGRQEEGEVQIVFTTGLVDEI